MLIKKLLTTFKLNSRVAVKLPPLTPPKDLQDIISPKSTVSSTQSPKPVRLPQLHF